VIRECSEDMTASKNHFRFGALQQQVSKAE
jgi:hypothetical protein